jgi:hypothetical protein
MDLEENSLSDVGCVTYVASAEIPVLEPANPKGPMPLLLYLLFHGPKTVFRVKYPPKCFVFSRIADFWLCAPICN